MGKWMVKECSFFQVETSMKENSRKGKNIDMELTLGLMEVSMKGNSRMGRMNGQGTYTWSDGSKYVGEWKGDEMWNGTIYDKDGNIIKKVVNGKMINQ